MIEYENRRFIMKEVATFPKWALVNDELTEAYYLIRLRGQDLPSCPRLKKLELREAIKKRGWEDSDVIIETADLPFLDKSFRGEN